MTEAEKSALAHRVLASIGKHTAPAEADVLLLHLHYPEHDEMEPDELACLMLLDLAKERRTYPDRRNDSSRVRSALG